MTNDKIIDMAREAGLEDWTVHGRIEDKWVCLEKFYDLAVAAEREAMLEFVNGYDLDAMAEAFSRVIEAHYSSKHPFHNPINMDAQMALRILRRFIMEMKH